MKKIVAMMLALLMGLSLVACSSTPAGEDEGGDKENVLVMGTSADYAPYEFMYPDDNGEMVYGGVDISIAKAIAEDMGKELKVENMSFEYMLKLMVDGKCDIVLAAMEITPDRDEVADFSDPYFTDLPAMIVVKKADAAQYTSMDSFSGKSVAAQTSTTKEDIVKNDLTGANLVSLSLATDMVNQLVNGKVDAIVLDGAVAQQVVASNDELVVADVALGEALPYRVAVAEGDPLGLLPQINETIAKLLADGSIDKFFEEADALSGVAEEVTGTITE